MPVDPGKLCECHGEPMMLRPNDGFHECRVKKRERNVRFLANKPETRRRWNLENAEKVKASRWRWKRNNPTKVYVSKRKHVLKKQRAHVLEQLGQLQEEAKHVEP